LQKETSKYLQWGLSSIDDVFNLLWKKTEITPELKNCELQWKFAFTEEVCSFNETKAQDFWDCIWNFLANYNSQQTA
jgi:hypothetical protein